MLKISIIMPIYQAEEFLEDTITNFTKQKIDDMELICINDGSTDKSGEILEKLKEKYDFIKIINQPNHGSGAARNRGIKEAKGKYIAFLDADDRFMDSNAINEMYTYAIKNNADIVCANLERVSVEFKSEGNFNYDNGNYTKFTEYTQIKPQEYGIPWAFYKNIYKKDFLVNNNITFPNLKRGQDPVFLAKALTSTYKIYTTPHTLYGYNYMANGGANSKVDNYDKKYDYIKHYQETIQILEDAQYYDLATRYKQQLVIYIGLINNRADHELLEIIHEIFEDGNKTYFNTIDEEQIYLMLSMLCDQNISAYNNEISIIKKALLEHTLTQTTFTDAKILKAYIKQTKLLNTNDNHRQLKELNQDLLSSTSWKITSPLRSSKKATVKVLKKCKQTLVKLW